MCSVISWLSATVKLGFTVTVTSTNVITPWFLPLISTQLSTFSTDNTIRFIWSSVSASNPSVNVIAVSKNISIAVFIMSKPTIIAATVSKNVNPKNTPTIPINAPSDTSASDKLSAAAALSALESSFFARLRL
ncbi:hypothetical protein MCCL_1569 [Macrococcoides caseolyticum JCSC5402]|uniref:Uncharacterized protein n=1 Tax=Macrococcus caseolyticus (strain JCSC5402) TaxID=458233 RepID=B9E7V8_MACCJ|nr:hypothetical protein MCCL_1569 [Macrococcus caseolyticus JCSC5402]